MEAVDANSTSTNVQVADNETVTSEDANIKSAVDGKLVKYSLKRVKKLMKHVQVLFFFH